MQIDTENYGSITAIILSAIGGLGWWLRRERVESSKAQESISASNASSVKYDGQAEEIIALRQEVGELRKAFVAQAALVAQQQQQISVLQASQLGVSTHFDNLLLCDTCRSNNKKLLAALEKAIEKSIETYVQETKELHTTLHPTEGG